MRPFLLIPNIRIHNANAMSSPYSIGFPAMTAWLGAVHALQRKLQQLPDFETLCLSKVGVSCHQLEVQTHRSKGDFVSSIIGTGNPLDKDGSRPSFIEEARCHVTVSLLIEMSESDPEWEESLPIAIAPMLRQMKMAAGDVLSFRESQVLYLEEGNASELKKLTQRLMLGHVLVERRQLLQDYVATNPEQDVLHALLAHLHIRHRVAVDANQEAIAIGHNQYLCKANWVAREEPAKTRNHISSQRKWYRITISHPNKMCWPRFRFLNQFNNPLILTIFSPLRDLNS